MGEGWALSRGFLEQVTLKWSPGVRSPTWSGDASPGKAPGAQVSQGTVRPALLEGTVVLDAGDRLGLLFGRQEDTGQLGVFAKKTLGRLPFFNKDLGLRKS